MNFIKKYPWIIPLVFTIAMVGLYAPFSSGPHISYIIPLQVLFMLRETKRDERTKAIIVSAGYDALILGLVFYYLVIVILGREFTVGNFLIIVFVVANILRYSRQYVLPALGLNKRKGYQ